MALFQPQSNDLIICFMLDSCQKNRGQCASESAKRMGFVGGFPLLQITFSKIKTAAPQKLVSSGNLESAVILILLILYRYILECLQVMGKKIKMTPARGGASILLSQWPSWFFYYTFGNFQESRVIISAVDFQSSFWWYQSWKLGKISLSPILYQSKTRWAILNFFLTPKKNK